MNKRMLSKQFKRFLKHRDKRFKNLWRRVRMKTISEEKAWWICYYSEMICYRDSGKPISGLLYVKTEKGPRIAEKQKVHVEEFYDYLNRKYGPRRFL